MMNESKQELSYSFLTKMEDSAPADSVLALGQKLVAELGMVESTDTLGRWMAHYIAGLMTKVNEATGDERIIAERECFATILEIWKYRAALPDGSRPFENIEPVMRAVESLDPENDVPRYYRSIRPPKGDAPDTSEQKKWLDAVDGLDYSAKALISYCLSKAAENAMDKSKEWVKLAAAIGDKNNAPEIIVRLVLATTDLDYTPDKNDENRSILDDKIKRLRSFLECIEILISALEAQLQALPSSTATHSTGEELIIAKAPTLPNMPR